MGRDPAGPESAYILYLPLSLTLSLAPSSASASRPCFFISLSVWISLQTACVSLCLVRVSSFHVVREPALTDFVIVLKLQTCASAAEIPDKLLTYTLSFMSDVASTKEWWYRLGWFIPNMSLAVLVWLKDGLFSCFGLMIKLTHVSIQYSDSNLSAFHFYKFGLLDRLLRDMIFCVCVSYWTRLTPATTVRVRH